MLTSVEVSLERPEVSLERPEVSLERPEVRLERPEAPTVDDARSAAEALVAEGVSEVWLYGSVARGEAHYGSDIDLVAVFDDLDYRKRWGVVRRLQRVAVGACGRAVEVLVTDRAEWRIQCERVTASFASAISCDLKLLACSPDPSGEVDWDKEQVMATSNEELAIERLRSITANLHKISAILGPERYEQELARGNDRMEYESVRAARMIMICEASQLAVENAAKAVAVLGGAPAPQLWVHDIAQIVESIDGPLSEDLRMLLRSAPELVKHEGYITMWRTRGAYKTSTEGMTAQEIATPAFTRAIIHITCDIADYTARTARHYLGPGTTITELGKWSQTIRRRLTDYDITTGETNGKGGY